MVFVPWNQHGICRFWAMKTTTCHRGIECKWKHPPVDEMKQLVNLYIAAEGQKIPKQTPSYPVGRAQLLPQPPAPSKVEANAFMPHGPTQTLQPPGPSMDRTIEIKPYGSTQTVTPGLQGANSFVPSGPNRLPPPPPLNSGGQNIHLPHGPNWMIPTPELNGASSSLLSNGTWIPPPPGVDGAIGYVSYGRALIPPPPGLTPRPPDLQMRRVSFQSGRELNAPRPRPQTQCRTIKVRHDSEDSKLTPSKRVGFQEPPDRRTDDRSTLRGSTSSPSLPAFDNRPRPPMMPVLDPRNSHNPYINGTKTYRFVWGKPLCVYCGTLGHLPHQCRQDPLSKQEQDCLHKIVRDEQNRNKAERGLDYHQPPSGLATSATPLSTSSLKSSSAPSPELDQSSRNTIEEVSMLDVPPSPKAIHSEEPGTQSEYWNRYKEQQVHKQQSLSAEEARRSDGQLSKTSRKEAGKAAKADDLGAGKEHVTAVNLNSWQTAPSLLAPSTASVPFSQPDTADMGATKRLSNGEAKAVGPHPSTLRVSASYITQSAIEKRLQLSTALDAQERSLAEAREDSVRLQGITWLDTVRRALQLPVRTFTTACVYYHKFRLAHPTVEYNWSDAAAASLLTSCKNEDTLKKSRDILAAAYNLKQPASHEQVGADDPIFEQPSRVVIGLERLVLESGGFDFRSRSPHQTLVKISKSLPESDELKGISQLAWTILTDLHRTFAPLKQTSSTLALASLELAANFQATTSPNKTCTVRDDLQALDLNKWSTTREEVMETLLDALDLYTHHTASTILGTKYSLDDFLRIRLAFNKECSDSNLPRYTVVQPPPSPDNANGASSTLRLTNGHPTPVSPPQAGTQVPPLSNGTSHRPPTPEGGGTLRFMLNPQRATEERAEVNRYYNEEWEEYEEEVEVKVLRNRSRDRDRLRHRDHTPGHHTPGRPEWDRHRGDDRRSTRDDRDLTRGIPQDRDRDRESLRDREREAERERTRLRDRDRERRYDDRRYDDRERDRRYDDRRDRDRDRDRRQYESDRHRGRESR